MDEDTQRERRLRNFEQLQQESMGLENGRLRRFVREGQSPRELSARRTEQQRLTMDRMAELERAAQRALRAAEQRARETAEALERLREKAARDEYGNRVYLDRDGRAFREDGTQLTPGQQQKLQVPKDAPTWEQYQDASRAAEDAIRDRDQVREFQRKLEQDPLDLDLEDMPAAVREQLENTQEATGAERDGGQLNKSKTSAAHEYLPAGPTSAPTFNAAATEQRAAVITPRPANIFSPG